MPTIERPTLPISDRTWGYLYKIRDQYAAGLLTTSDVEESILSTLLYHEKWPLDAAEFEAAHLAELLRF